MKSHSYSKMHFYKSIAGSVKKSYALTKQPNSLGTVNFAF